MALATIGLEAGKGIVAKFGTGFLAGTLITLGAKNLLNGLNIYINLGKK